MVLMTCRLAADVAAEVEALRLRVLKARVAVMMKRTEQQSTTRAAMMVMIAIVGKGRSSVALPFQVMALNERRRGKRRRVTGLSKQSTVSGMVLLGLRRTVDATRRGKPMVLRRELLRLLQIGLLASQRSKSGRKGCRRRFSCGFSSFVVA